MYFPYLYARQSELLALGSMVSDHRSLNSLIPIVEPVLSSNAQLIRLLNRYGDADLALGIVLNPDKHELSTSAAYQSWLNDVLPVVNKHQSIIPVFRCYQGITFQEIDKFVQYFSGRGIALAYSSPTLSDSEISALAARANVRFHIILDRKIGQHAASLLPRQKIVDLVDNFNKLSRNADYRGPEFFTDQHYAHAQDGLGGFGDYCSIGSDLSVSGGPAAAVAIHTVYKEEDGDIWVEHFVSNDTEREIGDAASKFVQAATKLVAAARSRPREFGRNFALDEFSKHVAASHFPNLAKSKELQIAHHICLVLDVVDGVL
jgi:hypothetical protein